jgi:hypothetical protein
MGTLLDERAHGEQAVLEGLQLFFEMVTFHDSATCYSNGLLPPSPPQTSFYPNRPVM